MAEVTAARRLGAAGLFLLGLDTSYNVGSFSLSAPQTTQWRVQGLEGSNGNGSGMSDEEIKGSIWRWVWVSSVKTMIYTGFASWLARSPWPFVGGVVVAADMHGSYAYAIRCGKRARTPAGRIVDEALHAGVRPR